MSRSQSFLFVALIVVLAGVMRWSGLRADEARPTRQTPSIDEIDPLKPQTNPSPKHPASNPIRKPGAPEVDLFPDPAWVKLATRPVTAAKPTTRPIPEVDHVLIVSIDGLRPDLLLRSETPTLHKLFAGGAYTFWAKTTAVSITLPSHTSMLTGVNPRVHGIEWNRDLPLAKPTYPAQPTLFFHAKRNGYTTAMIAGKSKFDILAAPSTIDYLSIPEVVTLKDAEVARQAAQIISSHQPELTFVHFPGTDSAGHRYGWGSSQQVEAIGKADAALATVLDAYRKAGLIGRTIVIVSADHGGAGKTHGPDDPRSRSIPWIVNGPGVAAGLDLTTLGDLEIRTEDTFATALWLLGIGLERRVEGRPVTQAFPAMAGQEKIELLRDADSEQSSDSKGR